MRQVQEDFAEHEACEGQYVCVVAGDVFKGDAITVCVVERAEAVVSVSVVGYSQTTSRLRELARRFIGAPPGCETRHAIYATVLLAL